MEHLIENRCSIFAVSMLEDESKIAMIKAVNSVMEAVIAVADTLNEIPGKIKQALCWVQSAICFFCKNQYLPYTLSVFTMLTNRNRLTEGAGIWPAIGYSIVAEKRLLNVLS